MMKRSDIRNAYDQMTPSREQKDRMLSAIMKTACKEQSGKGKYLSGHAQQMGNWIPAAAALVLVLFLATRARGRSTVSVFKRTIPDSQVLDAMTIVSIVVGLAVFGAVFISATSPISFVDAAYEAVSAIATVGLTAGATGSLSVPAQFLIILYMYFGRVGVLTISLGFLMGDRAEDRFEYARTNLLIG